MHPTPTSETDTRCQHGLPPIGGRAGKPRRTGKVIANATQRQPHQVIYEELQNAASAAQNVNQSQAPNSLNLPLSTAGYSRLPYQTGPFSHAGGSSTSQELPINSSGNPGLASSYCAPQLAVQSNGPSEATNLRARTSPPGLWNPNNRSQLWSSGPGRFYDPSSGAESSHIQNQTLNAGQLRMLSSSDNTPPLTDPVPNCAAPPTASEFGAVMDRCVRIENKLDFVIRLLSQPLARGSVAIPGNEIPTSVGNGHSVLTNTEIETRIFPGNASMQDITGSHKGMEDKITRKVRDARSLLCNFGAGDKICKQVGDGRLCPMAVLWARSIQNRPAGMGLNAGSLLGFMCSEKLRDPETPNELFMPSKSDMMDFIFLPTLARATKTISAVYLFHANAFFAHNRESIIGEIQKCLQNTLGTRRKEIIAKFKLCPSEKSIADCFHSSNAVNAGVYRSTSDCSIGDRRFCQTVISAFRIKGIPAKVTLSQLAFTCTTLTREYTKRNTRPALFQLVPGASGSKMEYEEKQEMHGLMCAALANRLSIDSPSTGSTWDTKEFQVVRKELIDSLWLSKFQKKLGTTKM